METSTFCRSCGPYFKYINFLYVFCAIESAPIPGNPLNKWCPVLTSPAQFQQTHAYGFFLESIHLLCGLLWFLLPSISPDPLPSDDVTKVKQFHFSILASRNISGLICSRIPFFWRFRVSLGALSTPYFKWINFSYQFYFFAINNYESLLWGKENYFQVDFHITQR